MRRAQSRRVESEAFHDAGRAVLHEHVGLRDHPECDLTAPVGFQVDADRFLAPVEPHEVRRQPVHGGVVVAREVALAGALELDHPGAEVGEVTRRHGGGDGLLERGDEYPASGSVPSITSSPAVPREPARPR